MQHLFDIDGKIALVTGGSRGIGEMIAAGFASAGAKTYISSRTSDVCDATASRLSEMGECISIPADLSSLAGVNYLVGEIMEREEKLDILVNNAGATWGAPLGEFPEQNKKNIIWLNGQLKQPLIREPRKQVFQYLTV